MYNLNTFFKIKDTKNLNLKMRGFTLIETLVAVTLFTFVTFVAITALFSLQEFNNKLKVTKKVYENIYLSMDIVSSDLKQGTNFENLYYTTLSAAGTPCSTAPGLNSADGCLSFDYLNIGTSNSSSRVGYYLQDGKIKKYSDPATPQNITSDDIEITKLKFILVGTNPFSASDSQQPMMKIILKGKSRTLPITDFSIENIISQRPVAN